MGRTKKANGNAMRNNNAKKMNERSKQAEVASYAEIEVEKMNHSHKK
jgi:hypothetical protein